MAVEPQQRTIGKYHVLGPLGRGAMGLVYKARDPEIGRIVAIKTLRKLVSSHLHDPDAALERFRNEARSAGNLRHPNIITIFEIGRDGDTPFIVMDYVEGQSLEEILGEKKRLDPETALNYLRQIGAALDYAHAKGVIHRDIKPANILVDRSNTVFILDFGIASIADSIGSEEPVPGSPVLGTPSYMAPEQILNEKLDPRADLFALGIVAFECFTGERPFRGETFTEVVGNIVNGKMTPLTAAAPKLPLALEVEFQRALARERDNRFAGAAAMIDAFARAFPPRGAHGAPFFPPEVRAPSRSEWALSTDAGSRGGRRASSGATRPPVVERARAASSEGFRGGPGGVNTRSLGGASDWSPWRVGVVVTGLASIFLAGFLVVEILSTRPGDAPAGHSIEAIEDRLSAAASARASPDGGAGESPLKTPVVEAAPPGKPIGELSDRQLLGVIVGPRSAEGTIVEALREGLRRRVGDLADGAVVPLNNDSYLVRIEAIKVLGELRDRRAVPRLVLVLDDHDPLVRAQAARTLGSLGDRRALGYLSARSSQEPSGEVRGAIKRAMEEISGVPAVESGGGAPVGAR